VKPVGTTTKPESTSVADSCLEEEPPGSRPLAAEASCPVLASQELQILCQSPPDSLILQPTLRTRSPRGVVVLYSQAEKTGTAKDRDVLADLETIHTAQAVAGALQHSTDIEVHLVPASRCVEAKLAPYPPSDYVVFNLFEGLDGARALDDEARTACVLEELGYRSTGADGHALALALNKAQAKAALAQRGILTPPWRVFAHADEVSAGAVEHLTFPVIVKPVAEDSSLGIDANAVVTELHSLRSRVGYITRHYRQSALVECFIDGREFNVALWGDPPQVLPLAEVELSALGNRLRRIVSFAAKWEESSFEYTHTPVTCPAVVADDLAARIGDTALRAWEIIGSHNGYGRVDMRVQGEMVYVLEVNPNPSIASDAGFARAARAAGFDYTRMVLRILSLIGVDLGVRDSAS
jgi:D-alanine-D-alanine ligase